MVHFIGADVQVLEWTKQIKLELQKLMISFHLQVNPGAEKSQ